MPHTYTPCRSIGNRLTMTLPLINAFWDELDCGVVVVLLWANTSRESNTLHTTEVTLLRTINMNYACYSEKRCACVGATTRLIEYFEKRRFVHVEVKRSQLIINRNVSVKRLRQFFEGLSRSYMR
ncbi:uncharacterized protein LOC125379350 [Haliotis rufescens]|uniref:uncharacterized protein LOC125379350 n=1 Tax=Haliotis rufescens TaxID=6454 RepID=UPI00201F9849|nr:uncharacterized protein LOC125379350 [Haliotis rufescens]